MKTRVLVVLVHVTGLRDLIMFDKTQVETFLMGTRWNHLRNKRYKTFFPNSRLSGPVSFGAGQEVGIQARKGS